MRFDQPMKNHTARFLLNNWVHYEKNIDELRPHELENAKIFFSGLQMLTQEEQIFFSVSLLLGVSLVILRRTVF